MYSFASSPCAWLLLISHAIRPQHLINLYGAKLSTFSSADSLRLCGICVSMSATTTTQIGQLKLSFMHVMQAFHKVWGVGNGMREMHSLNKNSSIYFSIEWGWFSDAWHTAKAVSQLLLKILSTHLIKAWQAYSFAFTFTFKKPNSHHKSFSRNDERIRAWTLNNIAISVSHCHRSR